LHSAHYLLTQYRASAC